MQTGAGLAHHFGQSGNLCLENPLSGHRQTVVATAGVFVTGAPAKLFYPLALNQLLQIVVQRARAKFVFSFGLTGDFLHDAVAVEIFSGERKQDMQGRRRQRKKGVKVVFHDSVIVISDYE